MSKCKIFIVRHTQTVGNVEHRLTGRINYEITEKGQQYIFFLTEALKDIKFDIAYSSPAERAKKTIEPLAKLNNISIIEKENLREMDFGIYDGWKWDDVDKINPNIQEDHILINEIKGIPEQETSEEVAERMYNCIEEIAKKNNGKTIIIASHGVAIEAFLRKIENVPFCDEREKFCQYNTAINELEYDNEIFKIVKCADIKHITDNE